MPVTYHKARLLCISGILLLVLALTAVPAGAQVPDLEVFVGDTTGSSGEQNSAISIYMNNYFDEIAGFTLWIQLSNPEIMEFQTTVDTVAYETYYRYTEFDQQNPDSAIDSVVASLYWVCQEYSGSECIDSVQLLGYYNCIDSIGDSCIDSTFIEGYDVSYIDTIEAQVGSIDTTGTLVSGWQRIETRSVGGFGYDMLIVGFANVAAPPYNPGIAPQFGSPTPLIRILGDIYDIEDTDTNRTVDVMIEYNVLDFFGFSDPDGNSIGIVTDTVTDTLYYRCLDWFVQGNDSSCTWWQRVGDDSAQYADSLSIVEYAVGHLDTGAVKVYNGSLTVLTGLCGDISGSVPAEADGTVNILDIIFLIDYKFSSGPPPGSMGMADVNCDLVVNILDIIAMIEYKFGDGTPLNCCPGQW